MPMSSYSIVAVIPSSIQCYLRVINISGSLSSSVVLGRVYRRFHAADVLGLQLRLTRVQEFFGIRIAKSRAPQGQMR